jgi:anti-sigma-K factor RskA
MTDHDRFGERAGAFALGALSLEERREFETHLAACADCRRDVREAALVAEGLGRAVEPQEPPAGLRGRVLAAALASPRPDLRRVIPTATIAPARTLPPWLLAAASIAAVALGLYAWTLNTRLKATDAELRSAQATLATLETQVADLRRTTDDTSQAADVLGAADVVRVDLAGQPAAPQAAGRAFWSPSRGLFVTASNLPALPAGRVYQLWLVTDSQKVSAGLLRPDNAGRLRGVAHPSSSLEPIAFAVTIEPEGGVPAPTGAMYLLGST